MGTAFESYIQGQRDAANTLREVDQWQSTPPVAEEYLDEVQYLRGQVNYLLGHIVRLGDKLKKVHNEISAHLNGG